MLTLIRYRNSYEGWIMVSGDEEEHDPVAAVKDELGIDEDNETVVDILQVETIKEKEAMPMG